MTQNWKIPLTPNQRLQLYLMLQKLPGHKGQEARKIRRFIKAIGLAPIEEAAIKYNACGGAIENIDKPSLFSVTHENVECIKMLMDKAERKSNVDAILEEIFDLVEMTLIPYKEYQPPEGIIDYDPRLENWTPLKSPPSMDEIIALIEEIVDTHSEKLPNELIEEMRSLVRRSSETKKESING